MPEYTSYKVPELRKLLGERGLPQAGNKTELINRLTENDKAGAAPAEAAPEETKKPGTSPLPVARSRNVPLTAIPEENKEDEITYSDDEAPPAKPAATEAAPAKDAATPAEAKTEAPPAPEESADKPAEGDAAASTEPKPEPVSYAAGLADTTAADEAKKRADRAKRFGVEQTDEEAKKKAERAERFGQDDKEIIGGLDSALPERPLKRGRGREGDANGRPDKRQSRDRRGGRGGNQQGGRRGGGRGGQQQAPPKKSSILDDPEQRAKAEARKARFATG